MGDDPLRMSFLDEKEIDVATEKRSKKPVVNPASEMRAQTAAKREDRLQKVGSNTRGDTSSAPPPPPQEPKVDKSPYLDKVTQYKERFPHLKSRNKVTAKSTLEEIEDELHYLEQQLGAKDSSLPATLLVLAMSGLEEMTTKHYNPLGLNLRGLAQVSKDNVDQFTPLLDELAIKYGTNVAVGVEMRLMMSLGTMVYTVHSANSGNVNVARAMEKMSQKAPSKVTDL